MENTNTPRCGTWVSPRLRTLSGTGVAESKDRADLFEGIKHYTNVSMYSCNIPFRSVNNS